MGADTTTAPAATSNTLSGLDALELAGRDGRRPVLARAFAATWPKLLALGLVTTVWYAVVRSGWRPDYVLPGPGGVLDELGRQVVQASFWQALGTTMRRGVVGFAIATATGLVLGVAVARLRLLRAAIGSMITALQTMPSIAWFPLAILLFSLTESAMLFVVVLGAAPSIANGVIAGVDYVPPLLLRAGRNIGARGFALYRYVIAPASLPAVVAGLKQGWAFAWRSLMAGELLVVIAAQPSLGVRLEQARQLNDAPAMLAFLIVVFVVGVVVDVAFSTADRAVRVRWGVAGEHR